MAKKSNKEYTTVIDIRVTAIDSKPIDKDALVQNLLAADMVEDIEVKSIKNFEMEVE